VLRNGHRVVAVAMTAMVHEGVLDKTSALTVGIFLPLLWGGDQVHGEVETATWPVTGTSGGCFGGADVWYVRAR
jgi:hypothetical protein